jgi:hypothetical protein
MNEKTYVGVDQDADAGLTPLGRMVRDAWVFGILPETETCSGWDMGRMQGLYEKVYAAWEPYAHLPSRLTGDLLERHTRIYSEAISSARKEGWNPELSDDD